MHYKIAFFMCRIPINLIFYPKRDKNTKPLMKWINMRDFLDDIHNIRCYLISIFSFESKLWISDDTVQEKTICCQKRLFMHFEYKNILIILRMWKSKWLASEEQIAVLFVLGLIANLTILQLMYKHFSVKSSIIQNY